MKQKIYFLGLGILLCLGTQQSFAQSRIQVGVGVANTGLNFAFEKSLPSVENLGIGVYATYTRFSYGLYNYGGSWNYFDGGVRAVYHVNELLNLNNDKIDLYGAFGLGLGYGGYTYRDANYNDSNVRLSGQLRAGGNYKFNEKMGGFGEIGWGPSWITLGISFGM